MESETPAQEREHNSGESPEQSPPQRTAIPPSEPSQRENTTQPPRNEPKKRCWRDKRWRHPQVIVNGALAFVAVIAAIIYYCQLQQMRKSTDAATQAVKLSRDTSHLDQRAWVTPTTIGGKAAELNNRFEITVQIKNTGKTVAKRLSGVVILKVKELSDPDPNFAADEAKEENVFDRGLLAPNDTLTYTVPAFQGSKLTQEQIDSLRSPVAVTLVFGQIKYWDIFDCEHWTTFSYRCNSLGDCYHYGSHNDADDKRCP